MAKRGRPAKHRLVPRQRKVPLAETPEGYDAICGYCGDPFTFYNSMECGTRDYKNFCTQGCEDEAA